MSKKAELGREFLVDRSYKLGFYDLDDTMALFEREKDGTYSHVDDIDLSAVFEQVFDIVVSYETQKTILTRSE